MSISRDEIKSVVSYGNGLSSTGSSNVPLINPIKALSATASRNPHYSGEDDTISPMTGQGDGNPSPGSGQKSEKWGHVTSSGSRVEIDDTPGSETIQLVHHSGAAVTIDPDGSIHMVSSSRKGIGISAPFGDAFMSASGDVAIKGSSLSVETSGDANFVIGGAFNIASKSYKLTTNVMDETINGSASRSIVNDNSVVIGGLSRTTIAGDSRTQVTGNFIHDVGASLTQRVSGDMSLSTIGNSKILTNGNSSYSTKGNLSIATAGTTKFTSKGNMDISTDGNLKTSSSGSTTFASSGDLIASATGSFRARGNSAKISGNTASLEGVAEAIVSSEGVSKIGGPIVRLAAPNVLGPIPAGSGGTVSASLDGASSTNSATDTEDGKKAETMGANDIIDELTSIRKFPQYQKNAKMESATSGSVSTISYDSSPDAQEAYDNYSSKNYGNMNSTTPESYGTIPEVESSQRASNITGVNPDIETPSNHNFSSKISRYFSLGDLVNANSSHPIPPSKWDSVVKNHILVAYNVLDPIKEKFPDMLVTSAYRGNSKNHITGLAIDLVVSSRDISMHAEIARYVRDNLPVDQVFLERNTSGRTHVHVRYSASGGAPSVLTCGDPQCNSRVAGIQLEYLSKSGRR